MSEKAWLKEYPEGVPAEIDVDAYQSLVELFEQSCAQYGERIAFVNFGTELSYAQLEARSRDFASYLQHELELQPGTAVALMLPNLLQYPVTLFGVLRAGCIVVNINPLFTPRELAHHLSDSGAHVLVALDSATAHIAEVLPKTQLQTVITSAAGDLLKWPQRWAVNITARLRQGRPSNALRDRVDLRRALTAGATKALRRVELKPTDVAFYQYTGGTTGAAKGAILTHRNLLANVEQTAAWLDPYLEYGDETIITALPLYHIFALTGNCLVFLQFGGRNILITDPRDRARFVETLKQYRFTIITGVNTLFNTLLNTPTFAEMNFSRLKLSLGGGAAIQRAVSDRWQAVTGRPIIEAYGLTETSPGVCMNRLDNEDHNGSIGLPLPSTDVACLDADGQRLPAGEVGELAVRGPQVMRGYLHREQETAKAITPDGFFRTGDMAMMAEDGHFHLIDRKKDLILVSGFNVYPNEVEAVVARHPGVLEGACVGIPDDESGEAVKLFVVRREEGLTAESLAAFCREHLAAYKVPKQIQFLPDLPKSNVGKILREQLRQMHSQ